MTTDSFRTRRNRTPRTAREKDVAAQLQETSSVKVPEIGTVDELRAMRIQRFRRAVAAGTYYVDSLTIADKLLERLTIFKPKAM